MIKQVEGITNKNLINAHGSNLVRPSFTMNRKGGKDGKIERGKQIKRKRREKQMGKEEK